MSRSKSPTTIFLEKLAPKSGLSIKYLRDLKLAGMPVSSIEAALRWIRDRPDSSPATSSVEALRLGRLKLVNLQSEKAALALAVERGELVSREEVSMMFSSAGHAIRGLLLAIESGLIPKIHGKQLSEAQAVTRTELNKIITSFQDAQSSFWRDHPTEKPD